MLSEVSCDGLSVCPMLCQKYQVEVHVFANNVRKLKAYINKHVRTVGFIEAKIAQHHTMFFKITVQDYFFDNF